jgi:hypothetical protein
MTKIDRSALSVFTAPDPESGDGNASTAGLLDAARAIQDDAVAIRRRIHRQPEIGLDLPKTQAVVLAGPGRRRGGRRSTRCRRLVQDRAR